MMDWTDRHCRYFLRGFSPRVLLYTEMITAEALLRGDAARLLQYSSEEQPLALQLGGSAPARLAAAARLGEQAGYREINLNCGCPSDRVHAGAFGACLMAQPALVAECVEAMRAAVAVPVTVKMRIGTLESGTGQTAGGAPGRIQRAGLRAARGFHHGRQRRGLPAIHCARASGGARGSVAEGKSRGAAAAARSGAAARRAVSRTGADPERRRAHRTEATEALGWCAGVMLGREAYHRPHVIGELHRQIYADGWESPGEDALLERMASYAERELAAGTPLAAITRHMLGLYAGQPGARAYRQMLSAGAREPGAGADLLRAAAQFLPSIRDLPLQGHGHG